MSYDVNMDPECIRLCDTLNVMPGVRTVESCCGHGTRSFRIWFEAVDLDALRPLLNAIYDDPLWRVDVRVASGSDTIVFCLEGPADVFCGDRLVAELPIAEKSAS